MPIALNNLISTRSILTLLSPQAGTKGLSRSFHTPIRNYEIELYRIGHGSSKKIIESRGHPRYTGCIMVQSGSYYCVVCMW